MASDFTVKWQYSHREQFVVFSLLIKLHTGAATLPHLIRKDLDSKTVTVTAPAKSPETLIPGA
jgi:hypothetical protein